MEWEVLCYILNDFDLLFSFYLLKRHEIFVQWKASKRPMPPSCLPAFHYNFWSERLQFSIKFIFSSSIASTKDESGGEDGDEQMKINESKSRIELFLWLFGFSQWMAHFAFLVRCEIIQKEDLWNRNNPFINNIFLEKKN